ASDGFFESVVLPRGQVWQKVGRDRHGCLRSRSWSKDGQSTNGRRSLGREPILLPSNLCLFWSQASTSCLWPPRSVPISVLSVDWEILLLNLHEAVTNLDIAALEAPPSFLQPQGQSLVLRLSLEGLLQVSSQHDPDPP